MEIRKGRLGQFFLFVGLILLVIFFVSDSPEGPQVGYFFAGLLTAGIGVYTIWRDWKPPAPTNRFRMVRSMRNRPKKDVKKDENRN